MQEDSHIPVKISPVPYALSPCEGCVCCAERDSLEEELTKAFIDCGALEAKLRAAYAEIKSLLICPGSCELCKASASELLAKRGE